MTQEVILKVAMMCGGCEAAVKRVLTRMEGVSDVTVDLPTQKVIVKGDLDPQKIVETVSKTGKKTELWS